MVGGSLLQNYCRVIKRQLICINQPAV